MTSELKKLLTLLDSVHDTFANTYCDAASQKNCHSSIDWHTVNIGTITVMLFDHITIIFDLIHSEVMFEES